MFCRLAGRYTHITHNKYEDGLILLSKPWLSVLSAWLNTAQGMMLEAYRPKTDFAALIKGELLVLFALRLNLSLFLTI